jgi:hypothetical protein
MEPGDPPGPSNLIFSEVFSLRIRSCQLEGALPVTRELILHGQCKVSDEQSATGGYLEGDKVHG